MMATAPSNLPAMQSGGKVAAIVPTNFNEVVQIAGAIVRADMAPASYRGNTEKATVAILAGMEVGLTPFAALQSIAVINGTPALFGDGLVALVRASGLLEDLQEGLTVGVDGQPMLAWCKVKRRGEASWKERELNWVECVKAGWTKKPGPWALTPGRMMTIRCRGWLFRDVFADVLKGLKSAEEVQDMVDVTPQGSATVSPVEPQRSDPKYQSPPDAPPSQGATVESGQPASSSPQAGAGSDSKPEAAGQPANITDVEEVPPVEEKAAEEPEFGPERPRPGEKLEFMRYSKVAEFCYFADHFLSQTNAEGAAQFEAQYEGTLVAMERGKKGSQDAAKEYRATLAAFRATGREPGEEG